MLYFLHLDLHHSKMETVGALIVLNNFNFFSLIVQPQGSTTPVGALTYLVWTAPEEKYAKRSHRHTKPFPTTVHTTLRHRLTTPNSPLTANMGQGYKPTNKPL